MFFSCSIGCGHTRTLWLNMLRAMPAPVDPLSGVPLELMIRFTNVDL
jgi:hypothetical protein